MYIKRNVYVGKPSPIEDLKGNKIRVIHVIQVKIRSISIAATDNICLQIFFLNINNKGQFIDFSIHFKYMKQIRWLHSIKKKNYKR